ncbi:MAG: hypothetical protein CMH79_06175 [Nitrospinae bacterium]|nr:hypothetical protein [Nitrospinota bacterium]|tara:strand:- start:315 stop:683 length:369 start_codon:yes stop_codon:yes gene_type:complete
MSSNLEEEYSDEDISVVETVEVIDKDREDIDINIFNQEYEKIKTDYKTKPFLTKYERTRVLSERTQQLANGSISFLKNPEAYHNIYEIAIQELRQKKIPFIIKRSFSSNNFELWKLEDLLII